MTKETKDKWRATMLAKYGSEEAVSAAMRERQRKSRENYSGDGGFRYLAKTDPAKLKEISTKAGTIGKRKAAQ